MAYNPIEVRTALTAAVENTQPKLIGLTALFPNENVGNTEYVELDKMYSKAKVAQFVNPEAEPDGTEAEGFTRTPFKLPTLQEVMAITGKDIKNAQYGVSPYDERANMDILAGLIARRTVDIRNSIDNAIGKMSIEAAFDGRITVIGKGENRVIDFGRPAELFIDVGAVDANQYWNNTAAKADEHIEAMIELLGNYGGAPDVIVGRPDTIGALLKTDAVKGELDNRRVEIGGVTFENMMSTRGMIYKGTYKNLMIFAYSGSYYDAAGTLQKAVPAGKVLIGSTNNGNVREYGDSAATLFGMIPGIADAAVARDDMNYVSAVYLSASGKEVNIYGTQCAAPMQADMGAFGVLKVFA